MKEIIDLTHSSSSTSSSSKRQKKGKKNKTKKTKPVVVDLTSDNELPDIPVVDLPITIAAPKKTVTKKRCLKRS